MFKAMLAKASLWGDFKTYMWRPSKGSSAACGENADAATKQWDTSW